MAKLYKMDAPEKQAERESGWMVSNYDKGDDLFANKQHIHKYGIAKMKCECFKCIAIGTIGE